MGKVEDIFHEELIDDSPDRHSNMLKIEKSNGGELHIHYRNLKIAIIDQGHQDEWLKAFKEAKANLGDLFKEDI